MHYLSLIFQNTLLRSATSHLNYRVLKDHVVRGVLRTMHSQPQKVDKSGQESGDHVFALFASVPCRHARSTNTYMLEPTQG